MVLKGVCRLSSNQNMSCHLSAQVLGDNQRRWCCQGAHGVPRNHFSVLSLTYAQCIRAFLYGLGPDQRCIFWTLIFFILFSSVELDHSAPTPCYPKVMWAVLLWISQNNQVQTQTVKDRLGCVCQVCGGKHQTALSRTHPRLESWILYDLIVVQHFSLASSTNVPCGKVRYT